MTRLDTLRCACVQLEHTPFDSDALFQRHVAAIKNARDRNIALLVFPEASLTGYPPDASAGRRMAAWADDPRLIALAEACGDTTAVVGFVEEGRGGNFYNSIAWLQNGEILKIYRKINLPTYGRLDEGKFFTAGTATEIVEIDRHWICGGMICADAWDPGLLYLTALRKATVLALPIASTREAVGGGFSNGDGWNLVTQYAALTYGLPILRCNWVGAHVDMRFWGGSTIYDPRGRALASASDTAEMIVAELVYEDLITARQTLPTTRTLSPEVLQHELLKFMV